MKGILIICLGLLLFNCAPKEKNSDSTGLTLETDSASIEQFDPDGYYYLKDTLRYKEFELGPESVLDLFIVESSEDFKRRPKDSVFIALNFRNTITNTDFRVKTTDFLITRDTLVLNFYNDQIGDIKMFGRFTGSKGPYYDNVEVFKTVVLRAKLVFKDTTFTTSFTWWEGD